MYSFESLCRTLLELLSCPELHSILRLVLKAGNYMNAVSHSLFILLSFSLYFQSGIHLFNPSQHTCSTWPGCVWGPHSIRTWDSLWKEYVLYHSPLVRGFSGRLCGERRWFSDFFAAQAGRHQGQQAGHESAPFCCYGKS